MGENKRCLCSMTLLLVFLVRMVVQTVTRVNIVIQKRVLCLCIGLYTSVFWADLFWIHQVRSYCISYICLVSMHVLVFEGVFLPFLSTWTGCMMHSSYWGGCVNIERQTMGVTPLLYIKRWFPFELEMHGMYLRDLNFRKEDYFCPKLFKNRIKRLLNADFYTWVVFIITVFIYFQKTTFECTCCRPFAFSWFLYFVFSINLSLQSRKNDMAKLSPKIFSSVLCCSCT